MYIFKSNADRILQNRKGKCEMTFPKILDGACVLYYTQHDYYGTVRYTTGEIADHICYLVICEYENDTQYYKIKSGIAKQYRILFAG